MNQTDNHGDHDHDDIRFTVDGETFTSEARQLTPAQIMTMAEVDAATHYLIEIERGGKQESFRGKNETPLELERDEKFITASTEPTPVS